MAGRILLFVAGLLAAACFACVPAGGPLLVSAVRFAGCPVVDNIAMLPQQFAGMADPRFVPPANLGSAPHDMSAGIKAAFDRAPVFFQNQVCSLDGIYIAPGGDSWGLRNPDNGKRYIALSADLWSHGGQPQRFSDYKTGVVQRLLEWTGPTFTAMPNDPSHDPPMTVLAVMAHEFGHVLFYDSFVPRRGTTPTYDSTALCGANFFDQSWVMNTIPLEPVYWRRFDDIVAWHQHGLQIGDFQGYADGKAVGQFYDGKGSTAGHPSSTAEWASLLAGFAPDHDFVETFELFVLVNSKTPLKSLEISIPGYGKSDIPRTCSSRQTLVTKLTCMQKAFSTVCPTCTPCP